MSKTADMDDDKIYVQEEGGLWHKLDYERNLVFYTVCGWKFGRIAGAKEFYAGPPEDLCSDCGGKDDPLEDRP